MDARLAYPDFDPRAVPPTPEPPPPRSVALRKLGVLRRSLGWGQFAGWARHAFEAARRLHAARPIDAVWAIHGDDSCHEIAHRLRRSAGVPWVADFKDPWSFGYSPLAARVQRRATARRLASARTVTETCAAQAEADGREFGVDARVVYSGYDAELMAAARPASPGDGFAVTYLGSVGGAHDVRLLPGLFRELDRRGLLARGGAPGLRLHQYAPVAGELAAVLAPAGCADAVVDHGRVPRPQAFSLMKGSDALLVFPITRFPGKFVGLKELESMASGTPVLILGEPLQELRPVIEGCPQVRVVRNAAEGATFLEMECRAVLEGGRSSARGAVNAPPLAEFTWPVQAAVLSDLLARRRSAAPRRSGPTAAGA